MGLLHLGAGGCPSETLNGKGSCLEAIQLYLMVKHGMKILHAAHELKTAQGHFRRLLAMFGNEVGDLNAPYPWLNKLVKEIRKANGQEAIVLKNGAEIRIVARSVGGGRGFTADVLVFDEAMHLPEDAQAALLATISAGQRGDSLVVYTGTPPSPRMEGLAFEAIRRAGWERDPDTAWVEWSASDPADNDLISRLDLSSEQLWRRLNPGPRVQFKAIAREYRQQSSLFFARERLCAFDAEGSLGITDDEHWSTLATEQVPPKSAKRCLGISMSEDMSMTTIGLAVEHQGKTFVRILKSAKTGDRQWLYDFLTSREVKRFRVVVDRLDPAALMKNDLEDARVKLKVLGSQQVAEACDSMLNGIRNNTWRHGDQEPLNIAAVNSSRNPYPTGHGWSITGDAGADVSPFRAVTYAAFGLTDRKLRTAGNADKWAFSD